MATEVHSISDGSRLMLAIEAAFPVACVQAYIWSVPHSRPRWLDLLFGLALTIMVILVVLRRDLCVPASSGAHVPITWRTFGIARGASHRRSVLPLLVFTLVVVGALLLWGGLTGHLRRNADLLRALAAYPVWGLLQQAVIFGVVYPRLCLAAGTRAAPYFTALLFAAGHMPNPLLVAGGAVMVFVFSLVWERAPSLPLLALSHGIIGAVCDKALHVSMRVGFHYFEP